MFFALIFSFIVFFIVQLPMVILDCIFNFLKQKVSIFSLLYYRIGIFIFSFFSLMIFKENCSYPCKLYGKAFEYCGKIINNNEISIYLAFFILSSSIGFHLLKIFLKNDKIISTILFIIQTELICIFSLYYALSAIGS